MLVSELATDSVTVAFTPALAPKQVRNLPGRPHISHDESILLHCRTHGASCSRLEGRSAVVARLQPSPHPHPRAVGWLVALRHQVGGREGVCCGCILAREADGVIDQPFLDLVDLDEAGSNGQPRCVGTGPTQGALHDLVGAHVEDGATVTTPRPCMVDAASKALVPGITPGVCANRHQLRVVPWLELAGLHLRGFGHPGPKLVLPGC